jgi:hypothetical protein
LLLKYCEPWNHASLIDFFEFYLPQEPYLKLSCSFNVQHLFLDPSLQHEIQNAKTCKNINFEPSTGRTLANNVTFIAPTLVTFYMLCQFRCPLDTFSSTFIQNYHSCQILSTKQTWMQAQKTHNNYGKQMVQINSFTRPLIPSQDTIR